MTYTREQILNMESSELSLAVAEHIFQAKVIGKEHDPEAKLLIGWYGEGAWKPMRDNWRTAVWHRSEESAWLDCPKFAEDISAAWEVVEHMRYRESNGAFIDISPASDYYMVDARGEKDWHVSDPSVCVAICKAALLAVIL